ncbi:MAG: OsmC family protein [Archangium sp.]|nr:OsmC family protein [Archangium sp.]
MSHPSRIVVTLPGQRRVVAQVRGHVIHTDQPVDNGGGDTAPTPFELFLASLGTCAGIFVQGFCAKRGLSTEGLRLIEEPTFDEDGVLRRVQVRIEVPPGFPPQYREALVRVAEQCSVKRAIAAQPTFEVETVACEVPSTA